MAQNSKTIKLKNLLVGRELFLLILIIISCIVFTLRSEEFLTIANFTSIFALGSVYAMIAASMTVLFISGGFDLSVGTHLAFLGVVLGILLGNGVPVYISIILIILLGIFDGLIIGILIVKLHVDPFITTLGALLIFLGVAYLMGYGSSVAINSYTGSFGDFPESFLRIAGGTFFNIEYLNFYMIIIVVFIYIMVRNNVFFRQSYYIGGNPSAARLAGVKVNLIVIFNYILVSVMVAVATILRASRYGGTAHSHGGTSLSLFILAAVILGGASLKGGVGSILGSVFGVFLLQIINNGLLVSNVSPFYNDIFVGLILLASVLLDKFKDRFSVLGSRMSNAKK